MTMAAEAHSHNIRSMATADDTKLVYDFQHLPCSL